MLCHESGGALVAIAHVEPAWGYSFLWPDVDQDLKMFKPVLFNILKGRPVGYAMDHISSRLAALMSWLNRILRQDLPFSDVQAKARLPRYWTSNYDTRNYILLGDPAIRLKI